MEKAYEIVFSLSANQTFLNSKTGGIMPSHESIEQLKQKIYRLEQELQKYRSQNHSIVENYPNLDCASNQILSTILEHSQDVITVKDLDGRYVIANKKFCDNLELSIHDVLGKTSYDLLPPEMAETMADGDEEVIQSKQQSTLMYHFKGRYGEYDQVVRKFPIFNDAKKFAAIGLIANDISEQVLAEKKRQESEELFRKTFYTMPESINLSRASDGLFIDINEGFTNLTGFTREDVIGKTASEINLWKNIDDRTRLLEGLMENGYINNLEAEMVKKNGETGTGLISARILKIQDENYIISVTRDITERKQMEEALRENEQRFMDLAKLLPEAIFETDEQLKITYVNQRAAELLGISEDELISYSSFDFFSKEDQDRITENLKQSQGSGKIEPLEYQILKKPSVPM